MLITLQTRLQPNPIQTRVKTQTTPTFLLLPLLSNHGNPKTQTHTDTRAHAHMIRTTPTITATTSKSLMTCLIASTTQKSDRTRKSKSSKPSYTGTNPIARTTSHRPMPTTRKLVAVPRPSPLDHAPFPLTPASSDAITTLHWPRQSRRLEQDLKP